MHEDLLRVIIKSYTRVLDELNDIKTKLRSIQTQNINKNMNINHMLSEDKTNSTSIMCNNGLRYGKEKIHTNINKIAIEETIRPHINNKLNDSDENLTFKYNNQVDMKKSGHIMKESDKKYLSPESADTNSRSKIKKNTNGLKIDKKYKARSSETNILRVEPLETIDKNMKTKNKKRGYTKNSKIRDKTNFFMKEIEEDINKKRRKC